MDLEQARTDRDIAEAALQDAEVDLAEAEAERNETAAELETVRAEEQRLRDELENSQNLSEEDRDRLRKQIGEVEFRREATQQALDIANSVTSDLRDEIASMEKDILAKDQEIAELQRKHEEEKAELERKNQELQDELALVKDAANTFVPGSGTLITTGVTLVSAAAAAYGRAKAGKKRAEQLLS